MSSSTQYPLVHLSAADLVFKYGVQSALDKMAELCRTKRRTYRTPEYRADMRDELEQMIDAYDNRLPNQPDGAGVEFEWQSPTVVQQAGQLVMIRWRDRNTETAQQAAEQDWPTQPWMMQP